MKGRIAEMSPLTAANRFVRSWLHLIHGSFDPRESAPPPNGILIGSVIFAAHIRVNNTQTDTQTTLRATFVEIGRIICTACRLCDLIITYTCIHVHFLHRDDISIVLLLTTYTGKVMFSVVSVCLSVRPFVSTLSFESTYIYPWVFVRWWVMTISRQIENQCK